MPLSDSASLKKPIKTIYLIGSLRNPEVRQLAEGIRHRGYDVFDDWHAAGPEADDLWQTYEQERGHTYRQALDGHTARHTYEYDVAHLNVAVAGILCYPAGKSAHLEFGYLIGQGKVGLIYMPHEPERWDVMTKFATGIAGTQDELYFLLDRWVDNGV